MSIDPILIRNGLLISLSLIFLRMLYGRFRQQVRARDVPVPLHAELLALDVGYHPTRLCLRVRVRAEQEKIRFTLMDHTHVVRHEWPGLLQHKGEQAVELELDRRPDGDYFLEMRTDTQRTERSFRLQQA